MRLQARTGVHFDNRPGLFFERTADVLGDNVQTGDIQADHASRLDSMGRHLGMDPVGHVCRQIAVALDEYLSALRWAGLQDRILAGPGSGERRVQFDLGERRTALITTTRVAVQLEFDEFGDRVLAVTDHARIFAGHRGYHLVADNEEPVFETRR